MQLIYIVAIYVNDVSYSPTINQHNLLRIAVFLLTRTIFLNFKAQKY